MYGRALAFVIVVGLIAGLSTPGDDKASSGDAVFSATSNAKSARTQEDESESEKRGGSEVVLKRRENGHFYADVEVNGTDIEFMVDTGASGIALTRRDAERLGLFWNENELDVVGRGVSGAVSGKVVSLDRVELGSTEVRDVDAAIIPEGLDVSLLGQSFLSRFGDVRISGDEMVLR